MTIRNQLSSIHDVADYFLLQIHPSSGDMISHLKLQKLCYFAQKEHLLAKRAPLFKEEMQAWAHGPVSPALWRRFRRRTRNRYESLLPDDIKGNPLKNLDEGQRKFLAGIWSKYGRLSGWELEKRTHKDPAWRNAYGYGDRPPGMRCDEVISCKVMRASA